MSITRICLGITVLLSCVRHCLSCSPEGFGLIFHFPDDVMQESDCGLQDHKDTWSLEGSMELSADMLEKYFKPEVIIRVSTSELCRINLTTCCIPEVALSEAPEDVCYCSGNSTEEFTLYIRQLARISQSLRPIFAALPLRYSWSTDTWCEQVGTVPLIYESRPDINSTYQINYGEPVPLMSSQNVSVCKDQYVNFGLHVENLMPGTMLRVKVGLLEMRSPDSCIEIIRYFRFENGSDVVITIWFEETGVCPRSSSATINVVESDDVSCSPTCPACPTRPSSTCPTQEPCPECPTPPTTPAPTTPPPPTSTPPTSTPPPTTPPPTTPPPTTSTPTTPPNPTTTPATTEPPPAGPIRCGSQLENSSLPARHVYVLPSGMTIICDTETDGGHWIIFQRRISGDVDFNKQWADYEDGFGDLDGDINGTFWIGLKTIWELCNNMPPLCELRVDMEDLGGQTFYAQYTMFSLKEPEMNYRIRTLGWQGNATGDSLGSVKNRPFTTIDRDHDTWKHNCADTYGGGWWYKKCHNGNLNGAWGVEGPEGFNMEWKGVGKLTFSAMKLRPGGL